jgi:hypothetical protein
LDAVDTLKRIIMTITLTWWMIPTMITILTMLAAWIFGQDNGGYLSGIGVLILLVPALLISITAWIVTAFVMVG